MTQREHDILFTLTHKVRYFTVEQLARTWWTLTRSGQVACRKAAQSLIARGLLARQRLPIEPELDIDRPVFAWQPGEAAPAPWPLSRQLQSRWTEHAESANIFFASWTTARLFGGYGGGIRNSLQVTHDLHLSRIYLLLRKSDPESASRWEPDDLRRVEIGEKVPDVFIRDEIGGVRKVIEFGGKYDGHRVAKFHAHCSERGYPYELW